MLALTSDCEIVDEARPKDTCQTRRASLSRLKLVPSGLAEVGRLNHHKVLLNRQPKQSRWIVLSNFSGG